MKPLWKTLVSLFVLGLLLGSAAGQCLPLDIKATDSKATDSGQTRPAMASASRIQISPVLADSLLCGGTKRFPRYPAYAKANRIQGAVVLHAIIDKEGQVTDVKPISGHPDLVPAAVETVKEWHYHPALRDGKPVEVETTITVNYRLIGGDLSPSASESPAH